MIVSKRHQSGGVFVYIEAYMDESLKIKIRKPNGEIKSIKRTEPVKALRTWDEYSGQELLVLGVPFGGPLEGRDSDGEAFHKGTDIVLNIGDTRPVTYYHGYGPDDPYEWQETPAVIGQAKYVRRDKKGHWFEVRLDESEPLAKRIMSDIDGARASSGAVGHMVRMGQAGLIDNWPVGELALFDTNEWRQPANNFAVVTMKNIEQPKGELKSDELKSEPELEDVNIEIKSTKKDIKMEDETKKEEVKQEIVMPEFDYAKMAELIKPIIEEQVKAVVDEEPAMKAAPAFKKITKAGFSGDAKDGFIHWMKTGQKNSTLIPSIKADLQEGDDTEGGYLVPRDFVPEIFGKANERSVAVRAGARVINTALDVVDIPVEGTQASWSLTSEEGTLGTSALEFDQVQVTVYKSSVSPKISNELLADNQTNLESWLFNNLGERLAVHENGYTIAGAGSSQPQGILYGGTAGLTLDDTNSIAVAEIPELMGKLKEQYQMSAVWTMERATYFYLLGLSGNQFQLWQPSVGLPSGIGSADGLLMEKPVLFSDSMGSYGTSASKVLAIGDWSRYALVRNQNISVLRNPYLYGASGQTAFHFTARWGGAVILAEAFQYAATA